MPPGGPNSFIFMHFSAKNLQNNPNLGVGAPLGKILDPPLVWSKWQIMGMRPHLWGRSPLWEILDAPPDI